MTALARPLPDPERSLTRQLDVSALPASVRLAAGLAVAALLLWPLLLLLPDALSGAAWSGAVWSAAWSSVWQAAVASTLGVALAIPLGWAGARVVFPGRRTLRALLTLPIVTPVLGIALGAGWMLDGGVSLLILVHAGFGLAVGIRLSGGAWTSLDPQAAQTARTLGFGSLRLIRQLYLPALGTTLAAGWALSFALAVSAFGAAYLLASDAVPVLPEVIGAPFEDQAPVAGAAILLALLVSLALLVFARCRPVFRVGSSRPEPVALETLSAKQIGVLVASALLGFLVALGPLFASLHGGGGGHDRCRRTGDRRELRRSVRGSASARGRSDLSAPPGGDPRRGLARRLASPRFHRRGGDRAAAGLGARLGRGGTVPPVLPARGTRGWAAVGRP